MELNKRHFVINYNRHSTRLRLITKSLVATYGVWSSTIKTRPTARESQVLLQYCFNIDDLLRALSFKSIKKEIHK